MDSMAPGTLLGLDVACRGRRHHPASALFLLPWFFFLLNLQTLLSRCIRPIAECLPGWCGSTSSRYFNLGWFVYTVIKVKESVRAEFESRGWCPDGDLGYNVGLTTGILWIAAHFIGWIPFIGWVLPLAGVICWIIYWLKTSDLKNRLDTGPAWNRPGVFPSMYPPAYTPYAPRYPQGYGAPTARRGSAAPGAAQGPAPAQPAAGKPPAEQLPADQPSASEQPEGGAERPPAPVLRCRACGSKYDPGTGSAAIAASWADDRRRPYRRSPGRRPSGDDRAGTDILAASLMLLFSLTGVGLSVMPVIADQLQSAFQYSDSQIGLLTSVFMFALGATAIPAGLAAARLGGRSLLSAASSWSSDRWVLRSVLPTVGLSSPAWCRESAPA